MDLLKPMGGIAVVALMATQAHAATFYNDESAFNTATMGFALTLDDFSTPIAGADTITLSSGVASTNIGGVRFNQDNSVSSNFGTTRYNNTVDGDGNVGSLSITWMFPEAVTALSFNYFNVLFADGLNVTVDGATRAIRASSDGTLRMVFRGNDRYADQQFCI